MLRSLSNHTRLTIAVWPTQIAIIEFTRGWKSRPKCLAKLSFSTREDESDWQAALLALGDWLIQNKPTKAKVEILLSDRFAHYAIIPWSDKVQKRSEIAMLSRIHFEVLFGEPVKQWDIRTDCNVYGKASIGCALNKTFMLALQELFASYRLTLASLQPYFVHIFNRRLQTLNKKDMLLVVVEPDHCIMASLKKDTWQSIRNIRFGKKEKDLYMLIQREIILQGFNENPIVYLHIAESANAAALKQDVSLKILEFTSSKVVQPNMMDADFGRAI